MKTISLSECHKLLLDISKEFHCICLKHNIPYYMLGGTQLGAIRHNGFIPWDDDMDFGVPREYFIKLKEILSSELPCYYKLISVENTTEYYQGFIKIEDTRTMVSTIDNMGLQCGLNIDIFPLDSTNNNRSVFSRNYLIRLLYRIENYRFLRIKDGSLLKRSISILLKVILPFLNKQTIYNIIDRYLLINLGEYYANYYGAWGEKEIIDKKIFGEPQLYDFECLKLYGVQYPDKYLSALYGKYMVLPPEDKRHVHIDRAFYKD